jgi:hypothetical protein
MLFRCHPARFASRAPSRSRARWSVPDALNERSNEGGENGRGSMGPTDIHLVVSATDTYIPEHILRGWRSARQRGAAFG